MRNFCLMLAVVLSVVAVATDGSPRLTVNPTFAREGGEVHLMCRVPQAEENREVEWGVAGWTSSTRSLEGLSARVTHESWLHHAPCHVGPAFCRVGRAGAKDRLVTVPFEVTGCDLP